jgi:hypothetical protein
MGSLEAASTALVGWRFCRACWMFGPEAQRFPKHVRHVKGEYSRVWVPSGCLRGCKATGWRGAHFHHQVSVASLACRELVLATGPSTVWHLTMVPEEAAWGPWRRQHPTRVSETAGIHAQRQDAPSCQAANFSQPPSFWPTSP